MPSIRKAALLAFLSHQSLSVGAYDVDQTSHLDSIKNDASESSFENTSSCTDWFKDVASNIISFEDLMGSPDMEKILESLPYAGDTLEKIPDTVVNEKIQNHIKLFNFPDAKTELQDYFKMCLSRADSEEKVQLEADKEKIIEGIGHLIEEVEMNYEPNLADDEMPGDEMPGDEMEESDEDFEMEMNSESDFEDDINQGGDMDLDQALEIIDAIDNEDLRMQVDYHVKNGNFEAAQNLVDKFYNDSLVDIDDEQKEAELSSHKERLLIAIELVLLNQEDGFETEL